MVKKKLNHKFVGCEKAVYETLCYFGVFNYPVSLYRLCTFLISAVPYSAGEVLQALKLLQNDGVIRNYNGLYILAHLDPVSVADRAVFSDKSLERVLFACNYLKKIPWILFIGVTGSVAAKNATSDDDIDILIITEDNRLWLSRFFVVSVLKILKLYRSDKNFENKVCPNLFISRSAINWEHDKNVYIAHDICSMMPVFEREGMYFEFLTANKWVRTYFSNFIFTLEEKSLNKIKKTNTLLSFFNKVFMLFQIQYMRGKITSEKVTPTIAHFNRDDSKTVVLSAFQQLVDK